MSNSLNVDIFFFFNTHHHPVTYFYKTLNFVSQANLLPSTRYLLPLSPPPHSKSWTFHPSLSVTLCTHCLATNCRDTDPLLSCAHTTLPVKLAPAVHTVIHPNTAEEPTHTISSLLELEPYIYREFSTFLKTTNTIPSHTSSESPCQSIYNHTDLPVLSGTVNYTLSGFSVSYFNFCTTNNHYHISSSVPQTSPKSSLPDEPLVGETGRGHLISPYPQYYHHHIFTFLFSNLTQLLFLFNWKYIYMYIPYPQFLLNTYNVQFLHAILPHIGWTPLPFPI